MKIELHWFKEYRDARHFAAAWNKTSAKWVYRAEDHDGGWVVIRSKPLESAKEENP